MGLRNIKCVQTVMNCQHAFTEAQRDPALSTQGTTLKLLIRLELVVPKLLSAYGHCDSIHHQR